MTEIEFGQPLPANLDYAVSFGIPTWDSAVGYVEKVPDYVNKMATGYPRYFAQPPIQKLCDHFIQKYGKESESCRPFPSVAIAQKCLDFARQETGPGSTAHLEVEKYSFGEGSDKLSVTIAVVLASGDEFEIVREFWKLRGECVSSRLAESLHKYAVASSESQQARKEAETELSLANREGEYAKKLIRQRILDNHYYPFGSKSKILSSGNVASDPERDVYLVSSGMSSIFKAREVLTYWEEKRASNQKDKSPLCETAAVFGFPFKDTKIIMEKFGKCVFYGDGDSKDLKALEEYLTGGQNRILGAFIETPSNPMLNIPDLIKLRKLADEFGFFVIIDDTIGGLNVDVLPYADIVSTSLTKLFNGCSNAMGGCVILNPKSTLYSAALEYLENGGFEDLFWCEDATVLEVNSRDFEDRTLLANQNTERLLNDLILPYRGKIFKNVYYPTVSSKETLENYEAVKNERGGYGCMFSMTFYSEEDSKTFYDSLGVFKGPSNGTNFTLACPYVQLAHRSELEKVTPFGADATLVRVSVGLEDSQWILDKFSKAILAVERRRS